MSDAPAPNNALSGHRYLLVRPAHQAAMLKQRIEDLGGAVVCCPVVEIHPVALSGATLSVFEHLHSMDVVIFTSRNAVDYAMPHWPASCDVRCLAVGPATAAALQKNNLSAEVPAVYSSEGLLVMPSLQAGAAKRVCIVTGENTKPLLADTLRTRGVDVKEVPVYKRACVTLEASACDVLVQHDFTAVLASSAYSLRCLGENFQRHRTWLRTQQIVAVSQAMVDLARDMAFQEAPIVASSAMDDAVVAALVAAGGDPASGLHDDKDGR